MIIMKIDDDDLFLSSLRCIRLFMGCLGVGVGVGWLRQEGVVMRVLRVIGVIIRRFFNVDNWISTLQLAYLKFRYEQES